MSFIYDWIQIIFITSVMVVVWLKGIFDPNFLRRTCLLIGLLLSLNYFKWDTCSPPKRGCGGRWNWMLPNFSLVKNVFKTCLDTMHTRGTFPSRGRVPPLEGINYCYLQTMGRKDGFGRFELLRFSPSSATLPPRLNLSSSSCHHSLLLPALSGRAAVVGEVPLFAGFFHFFYLLHPWTLPRPFFQLNKTLTPSSPFLQLPSNYPKLLLEPFYRVFNPLSTSLRN